MVAVGMSAVRRWPSFAGLVRDLPMVFRRDRVSGPAVPESEALQRAATVRYHLGRGRRARESGNFGAGCSEARRAIDANPGTRGHTLSLANACCDGGRQTSSRRGGRSNGPVRSIPPTATLCASSSTYSTRKATRPRVTTPSPGPGGVAHQSIAGCRPAHLRRVDDAPVRAHARVPLSGESLRATVREGVLV